MFAKTEKLGHTTRHNQKVTITFAHGVGARTNARHGNRIHLAADAVYGFSNSQSFLRGEIQ